MIRELNKKNEELFDELEKRDLLINNLHLQIGSLEQSKLQIESFKKHVLILEEKVALYEKDAKSKENQLNEQLKVVSGSENRMRTQINLKDKKIKEQQDVLKIKEREVDELKAMLDKKNDEALQMREEMNQIKVKMTQFDKKTKAKEDSFKRAEENYEETIKIAENERNSQQRKIDQLLEIVKQQAEELNVNL